MVSFYCISKNTNHVPERPTDGKDWEVFYDSNWIGHNTHKRVHEPSQQIEMVTHNPTDADESEIGCIRSHAIACQVAGSFWDDKRYSKLFNSSDVKNTLLSWIEKLELAEFDALELEKLVNKSGEHPLELQHVFSLQLKAMYLRRAYQFALEDMPRKSWQACCERSIEILSQLGVTKIKNYRTIEAWNSYFRIAGFLPHPNTFVETEKEIQPKIFRIYPEARDELRRWANQNLELLNSDVAAEFIRSELVDKVYDQYLYELASDEIQLSKEEFLRSLNLTTVDTKTAFRWLKNLGFCFDVQKKVYFNDRHENPENIANRKVFINKYFEYELYAHHWVQLPADNAKHYEEELDDNGNKLMAGSFAIEWKDQNGILMREYYVDCHPDFFQSMSPLKTTRSLVVICLCKSLLIVIQNYSLGRMSQS